jgi:hypothetical protein
MPDCYLLYDFVMVYHLSLGLVAFGGRAAGASAGVSSL